MRKEIDFSQISESEIVLNYNYDRFRKGLGTNIYIIGLPGTGKSSFSIRYAQLWCRKIGLPDPTILNIADSLLGVLEFTINVQRPGEVLIIEEASVLFPSVRAMSQDNVAIAKVLDTLRKKRVTLITNAPLLKRMDSHLLALGNVLVETLKVNKTQGVVIAKPLKLQTNPKIGKTYNHRFKRNGRDVHRVITRMPDGNIWDEYEIMKGKFIDALYERLKHESIKKQEKLDREMKNPKIRAIDRLSPKELEAHQLVNIKRMKKVEAAKIMGVTEGRIRQLIISIERKCALSLENKPKIVRKDLENPIK